VTGISASGRGQNPILSYRNAPDKFRRNADVRYKSKKESVHFQAVESIGSIRKRSRTVAQLRDHPSLRKPMIVAKNRGRNTDII
jgi:hypothetical protein